MKMPEFILQNCATKVIRDGEVAYVFSTRDKDGWVLYWPVDGEILHIYRHPLDLGWDHA